MKVVCIRGGKNITNGKFYNTLEYYRGYYKIINDEQYDGYYYRDRFKTIEEVREERLNIILK